MSIPFSITTKSKPADVDLYVIPVFDTLDLPSTLSVESKTVLQREIEKSGYKGSWGSSELVIAPSDVASKFIALVGMGSKDALPAKQAEGLRRALAMTVHEARRHIARRISIDLTAIENSVMFAGAAYEAVELANYRFVEHRASLAREHKKKSVQKLVFVVAQSDVRAVKKAVSKASVILEGVTFTRNLVNQPASHVTPTVLVKEAKAIAKKSSNVRLTVMNRAQAERKKFTAFLAVARGSQEEPYVIHLTYKPKKKAKKKVVLIGKGITFDSGGLSLKPAQYMENMKIDMAGAATVLGLFSALTELNIPVEVHGVIAACENMPSGNAYRPGDVVVAKNGKTIEVLNTDAEGRITLADALSYATELKPDSIIDLATLTGACVVALGDTHAGLWSNNEELEQLLMDSAKEVSEGLVALPLPEEYRQTVQSKIADVRNTATVSTGGAITAALFLQEFVKSMPWAHIDIAGPVYAERPLLPYYPHGGTGYGIRTLISYLERVSF